MRRTSTLGCHGIFLLLALLFIPRNCGERHTCFTLPEDFAAGGLHGNWDRKATAYYDEQGRWVDLAEPMYAAPNSTARFGNLQCPMEPYFWSCGAGLGTPSFNWTIIDSEGLKDRREGWWMNHEKVNSWQTEWLGKSNYLRLPRLSHSAFFF